MKPEEMLKNKWCDDCSEDFKKCKEKGICKGYENVQIKKEEINEKPI